MALPYVPTTWASGDLVSSTRLNKLENGVKENSDAIVTNTADVNQLKSQINEVESSYPQKSASGSIVTIDDGADNVPVVSLEAEINPVQDLHGYESPWPAGGGKNLLNIAEFVQRDGYSNLSVSENKNVITITGYDSGGRFACFNIPVTVGEKYTIRHTAQTAVQNVYYTENDTKPTYWISGGTSAGGFVAYTLTASKPWLQIALELLGDNASVTNMIVEHGETDGTWSPYENICPISGFTGANIYQSGEDTSDPTVISITFPDAAGTVYGGTLTLNQDGTADLTVDRATLDLGSNSRTWIQYTAWSSNHVWYCVLPNDASMEGASTTGSPAKYISTVLKGDGQANVLYGSISGFWVRGDNKWFCVSVPGATTGELLRTAMNGQTLVYPITNPQTYHITDVELVKTMYLINNIWCDTGDIDLTYRCDPATYTSEQIQTMLNAMVAPVEATTTASKAYSVNEFLILNNTLYKVDAPIANGGTITIGTNVHATTVGAELTAILNS